MTRLPGVGGTSFTTRVLAISTFATAYTFAICIMETVQGKKTAWQHAGATAFAGMAAAAGRGVVRGTLTGAALGALTAPVYHYAHVVMGMETLAEWLLGAPTAQQPTVEEVVSAAVPTNEQPPQLLK